MSERQANQMAKNRVALVGGVRTPFVKAAGAFSSLTMQDLGAHCLRALTKRYNVEEKLIDTFVFSTVLLDPKTPNWAREILFQAGFPKSVYAQSVSNNCISGLVAITSVVESIQSGRISCGIAGGSESMSNPALLYSKRGTDLFLKISRARTLGDRLSLISKLRPRDFLPAFPGVTEPSTGLTMGQHMEITAKEMKILRAEQDQIAYASHQNAARAVNDGRLGQEIEPLMGVSKDNLIREDTSLEKLAKLKPVFDRSSDGTLTAGNSSALTDGASAVLLMSEKRAREEGREILAFIGPYQFSAIDPRDGLLMAPAIAVPRLMRSMGIKSLAEFDLVEIHEAFAAQVLANIKAWEQGWKEPAVGTLNRETLNTLGGSIAIGHPFAATGGRIVTTLANELKRKKLKRGLISICAAGAMGGAMVLERDSE